MGIEGLKPKFITFEGGEGAGKSTQVAKLMAFFEAQGIPALKTREPGGSPGAEEIRALLVNGGVDRWDGLTEVLLHSAARRDHLVKTVWPALKQGTWVVCDRFFDSTLAYQGWGHGIDRKAIESAIALSVGDFKPDLTLILDLDVDKGLARAQARGDGADRYERMGLAFHNRLRQGFLEIAAQNPNRCTVIDANQTPDHVHQAVIAKVKALL